MRTYAKKIECANAPAGPFTTFSHCAYGHNVRSELIYSRRDEMHRRSSASEGRFGVAEPEGCASICESQRIEVYWLRLLAVYMFVAKLNAATVAFPMALSVAHVSFVAPPASLRA